MPVDLGDFESAKTDTAEPDLGDFSAARDRGSSPDAHLGDFAQAKDTSSPTPETDKAVAQTGFLSRLNKLAQTPSPAFLQPFERAVTSPLPGAKEAIHAGYQYGSPLGWIEDVAPDSAAGKWAHDIRTHLEQVGTGFASPANIVLAATGASTGKAIQGLIGMGFTAQQAKTTLDTYRQWQQEPDPEKKHQLSIKLGVDAGLTALLGGGTVAGHMAPERARTAPEEPPATSTPPEAQTQPSSPVQAQEGPSGRLTREKIPIGYEFRAPNAADDFVMYRYEGNGEVTDLDTGQTHKLSQKQIDDTEGFIRTTPKYAKGVQPGPMYMLEPPASLASVYKPKPFEETTQTPQLKLLEGEPNAQQPSNAQVESGDIALREQARPQGEGPQTGSSDNVVGETGGEKPVVEGQTPQEDVAVTQPEGGGKPAAAAVSGAETPPAAEPPRSVTSLQNAVTEAERANRGLNPREATESQSWDKAKSIAQSEAATDPGKGARLVEELNQQPRALDDVEGVHLLNHKVEVNREFDNALENLRRNPEDVDAIARMTKAREDAYKMYQATEASGTAWGRGGRIRQAMMADDYSLSRMEATRRVANKGKPLSTTQMMEVADHYSKISKQEARIKVAEDSLQAPSGRMRPQEILNAVEQMKRRLTPCL